MLMKTMGVLALVSGIICVAMAVIILVYADGLRRWYSGAFFAVMGVVLLSSAARWRRGPDQ